MIWEALAQLVTIVFFLAGGLAALGQRPDLLLGLAVASLALGGFNVYALGTVWFPIKVVTSWSLLYVPWAWLLQRQPLPSGVLGWWAALLGWVLFAGALGYVIEAPLAGQFAEGLQGAALRPVVQLYGYATMLILTPLALLAIRTEEQLQRFWNIYMACALFSCLVAVVQFLMIRAGLPFMPILRMTGNHSEMAAFSYSGDVVQRLYAFAGEPKNLGVFLLPAALASLAAYLARGKTVLWWSSPALALVIIAVTVLTYSTAALIGLFSGLLVLIVLLAGAGGRVFRLFAAVVLLSACVFAYESVRGGASTGYGALDLIRARTTERLHDEAADRFETSALNYISSERPDLAFAGLGLGMYVFHLPGTHWERGVTPIDSGWVTSLLDLGLVGTSLLGGFCLTAILQGLWAARRSSATSSRPALFAAVGALVAASTAHLGWNVLPYLALWVGMIAATRRIAVPREEWAGVGSRPETRPHALATPRLPDPARPFLAARGSSPGLRLAQGRSRPR